MDVRLTLHRVAIVKDLEPKKHWNYLIQEGVLNDDDLEELKAEKTRKAQAELLIAKVLRAGRQNIDVFVNSLSIYQPHLCELLQSNLPERLQRQQGSTQATVENVTQQITGLHVHVEPATFVREALSPVEHEGGEYPFTANVETSKISDQQSRHTTQLPPDEEQCFFVIPTDLSKLPAHIHPNNAEEVYPMSSKPRGIALIINVEIFVPNPEKTKKEEEKEQLDNRQGSDKDIEMLEKLFGALDFKVKIERNPKREKILKVLDNISNEDHSNYDCFVLCLMSHGLEGFVYGADGERVLLEDVCGFFSNSRCRTLKGKPKLFVIQACRGRDKDKGVVRDSPGSPETLPGNPVTEAAISSGSADGEDDVADRGFRFSIPQYIPDQADMLMAYSTVSGYASFRNPRDGSRFVRCLVEVFREKAGHEDVLSMLTMVNNSISSMGEVDSKQVGQPTSTLTKKLFFWPGL
ncbi:unnamed protein product [Porites evermanni]|uniref:Caspase-8 n=1 Tax=Porites evermanni TaxID=104178 RepID=A0ABN8MC09_9CNID|nr:unnamed protein product [Porites evermanni]